MVSRKVGMWAERWKAGAGLCVSVTIQTYNFGGCLLRGLISKHSLAPQPTEGPARARPQLSHSRSRRRTGASPPAPRWSPSPRGTPTPAATAEPIVQNTRDGLLQLGILIFLAMGCLGVSWVRVRVNPGNTHPTTHQPSLCG